MMPTTMSNTISSHLLMQKSVSQWTIQKVMTHQCSTMKMPKYSWNTDAKSAKVMTRAAMVKKCQQNWMTTAR